MRTLVAMTAAGLFLSTALASAQTAAPTPTDPSGTSIFTDSTAGISTPTTNATSTDQGAFANLSPGNQKVARSLFEAQAAPTAPSPGDTTTAAATTNSAWSLDQIAATKQSGQGWGNIFKEMKAQGLVEAKNLGQVVSGKALPPPPSGETSGTGGTAGATSGGETATAAGSTMATRQSGRRDTADRGSEVTVTLGNNRDIIAASGPRSASQQRANGHSDIRSDRWAGVRGSETAGQHTVAIAGGRGSSVSAVGGGSGRGQERGGRER